MTQHAMANWDLARGEQPPVLQARCRTADGAVLPALCTFVTETECHLFVASVTVQRGERLTIECADRSHAGTVSSVEERIVRLSFEWPLARSEMRTFLQGEKPRWECDFGPDGSFKSLRLFKFPKRKWQREIDRQRQVTLRSGMVVNDKRRSARKPITLLARCRIGKGFGQEVVIADLSPEGCCIYHRKMGLTVGQHVTLRPAEFQPLPGVIRWISGPQAGVQFETPLYRAVAEHLQATHTSFLPRQREVKRRFSV